MGSSYTSHGTQRMSVNRADDQSVLVNRADAFCHAGRCVLSFGPMRFVIRADAIFQLVRCDFSFYITFPANILERLLSKHLATALPPTASMGAHANLLSWSVATG